MRTYEKPTAEKINFTYENQVVAESTATHNGPCFQVTGYVHQIQELGRSDFRIQLNAHHADDHTCTTETLTITFNQPVTFKECYGDGAAYQSGNGTNTLVMTFTYLANPSQNVGIGDIIVESDPGLELVSTSMVGNNAQ